MKQRTYKIGISTESHREGLRLVEQHEAEDTAKLAVLREAADVGFGTLDRGEFKEFDTIDDLQRYLTGLSKQVISGAEE
jgi:antitoxin ParD1/3/4